MARSFHLSMPLSIRGHKPLLVLLSLVVLGAAFYWFPRARSEGRNLTTVEVKTGSLTTRITETGELRARNSTMLSGLKDLPIIDLTPEGTHVKKGDIVARLDPSKHEATLNESKAALQVAQAELRKAEEDLEAQRQKLLADNARFEAEVRLAQLDLEFLKRRPLKDELERARMDMEKAKMAYDSAAKRRDLLPEFAAKGFITASTLEEAELKYYETKAALQVAEMDFRKVAAGAPPDELIKAQIRLEQARIALEKAQSGTESQLASFEASVERAQANVEKMESLIESDIRRIKRTDLRAPQDGLVVYAKTAGGKSADKIQLGMVPFEGQPLIYLPDLSTMVVDAEINEIDIGKVQVGGPVEVRLEAYPGVIFHGKVFKIGSLAKLKPSSTGGSSGIKVFDVTVQIEEKDQRLKPGLTATLDIIVEQQQDVLFIPLVAVVPRQGEHFVFVSNGGKIEERKVLLGPSNEHNVIVKAGLRVGEQVILGPPLAGPS